MSTAGSILRVSWTTLTNNSKGDCSHSVFVRWSNVFLASAWSAQAVQLRLNDIGICTHLYKVFDK